MKDERFIKAAAGEGSVDLLLTNARIVDVFTGQIIKGHIAIVEDRFVGIGDYSALKIEDLDGKFAAPGFIEPHAHIESSMMCVSEFVRAVLPRGTTAMVADPHEIANVLGEAGIEYMLKSAEAQPMSIYYGLPSCVPATSMETAGARLEAEDLSRFMNHPRIAALGEMMNFPGVIGADPGVLSKIALAKSHGKPVDGHAPGLSGKGLSAYVLPGISSDHECTSAEEALEKLSMGMHIMIRQGSAARNLSALLPIINDKTAPRLMWCTDDRHPHELVVEGHIDAIVREAISAGIDPVTAIRMATISPAQYFGFHHLGAIAPGRRADLVIFQEISRPAIEKVMTGGRWVAENGRMLPYVKGPTPPEVAPAIHVNMRSLDFEIPGSPDHIHVIGLVPNQIVTRKEIHTAPIKAGRLAPDPDRDLLKIAVIERHKATGAIGKGFVRGFGLRKGAIASSVAHDSHNIIVVGVSEADMHAAVSAIIQMGGGLCVAVDGAIVASLPLPIAGLLSKKPVEAIHKEMETLLNAAKKMGSQPPDPFMTLSFLALPVIPELKITDQGLVDVNTFQIIPLSAPTS
jgi:adenine deaminase